MHNLENLNLSASLETEPRITNLEAALARAQNTIEELKLANQQANELVSMATHQIRGPVAAMRGYVSLLLEGDYGPVSDKIAEPLNIIYKSTETLSKTVNDFLDVSRIDQGEMRYYRKDFDFAHLAEEVIAEMKKIINDAGIELKLNISTEPVMIHGDKAKIKHVLLNLIDNSCKYTKNGWMEISLERSAAGQALFCIKDSGVGIKPETMPLLFQKFSRCANANKSNIHGTGLGLYVANKMLEAQNGRIWAQSEGEGKGAQFYVEVPTIA
jgi:signal transduction histidine kinase